MPVQQTGQLPVQSQGAGGAQYQGPTPGTSRSIGRPLAPVSVEEIVATDVVTAQPDTPIATVVSKMADREVGSVVIVEDDAPVGVITDRAIALALENSPDVANKQAGDLVGEEVVTGTMEMTVFEALDRLHEEGIRRLPIVDDDGVIEGIVTLDDVLVFLGSELDKVGETVRKQSPRL